MLSTAEVTGAVDSDRGSRTQIRTRVPDTERWLRSYRTGLYRVIFYGNHLDAIHRLGRLRGFEVLRKA
jgi:hypothetical protein